MSCPRSLMGVGIGVLTLYSFHWRKYWFLLFFMGPTEDTHWDTLIVHLCIGCLYTEDALHYNVQLHSKLHFIFLEIEDGILVHVFWILLLNVKL